MTPDVILASLVVLLGGFGTWLLLPHKHGQMKPRRTHALGAGLAVAAVMLMALFLKRPPDLMASLFFYVFAFAALGGAILTITSKNPVYSALWFASVVLATSGLFLLAGAQFLAAGTVIVYAGAIIVTFLFVIMLAQSEGQAVYDRMARAPGAASLSGFILLWSVFYALLMVQNPGGAGQDNAHRDPPVRSATAIVNSKGGAVLPADSAADVYNRAVSKTSRMASTNIPSASHVAGLGATLFTDHLLAVELSGALLFVALIGAISIAAPRAPVRPASFEVGAAGDPAQAEALAHIAL